MGGCLLGSHPLYNRVSDCLLEVLSIQKPLSGEEGWEESLRVGNRRSAWGRRKDSLTEQKWSSFVQMNELSRARASSLQKNSQVFLANPCLLSFLFINSLPTPPQLLQTTEKAHPQLLMLGKGWGTRDIVLLIKKTPHTWSQTMQEPTLQEQIRMERCVQIFGKKPGLSLFSFYCWTK